MLSSGFTNAPVTRFLVIGTVVSALVASITDTKYYFWIEVRPHLFDYWQLWRVFTWQLCYTNSTEVLFAAMTFYQLRVIERLWGSRKFASFLISTFLYTTLLPPFLLVAILRPLSLGHINYLPAGPTPIVFALLAQYHAAIPYVYKYRVSSTLPTGSSSDQDYGLMLTSKSTSYLLPLQLALSQLPGSAIAAVVGWVVGFGYRRDVLPGAGKWRVPGWIIGGSEQKARYDTLRRRMEGEAGRATGVENNRDHTRRRGMVGGLIDQFRGGDTHIGIAVDSANYCRRDVQDERVTITVGQGDDGQHFIIPKVLLCSASEWFARALNDHRFTEGRTNAVSLPEDSVAAFEAVAYYMYFGDLAFKQLDLDTNDLVEQFHLCCEIWIQGDKLRIPRLQNCAIMRICHLLGWGAADEDIAVPTLGLCLQHTLPGSPLRKVALEYIVNKIQNGKAVIGDFDKQGILDNCAVELFEVQREWHEASGQGFPRFYRPIENVEMFASPDDADVATGHKNTADTDYNAMEWKNHNYFPTCERCGIYYVPRCTICPGHDCTCQPPTSLWTCDSGTCSGREPEE